MSGTPAHIAQTRRVGYYLLLLGLLGLSTAGFAIGGEVLGMVGPALLMGLFMLAFILRKPELAIWLMLFFAFTATGIKKYVPSIPTGLSLDVLLALCLGAIWLRKNRTSLNEPHARALMVPMWVWFGYTFLEVANPEAHSFTAWFYAVRGVSLYPLLCFIVALKLLSPKKHLFVFVHLVFVVSVLGTLWGMRQLYLGLDSAEWAWLRAGNESTHILHGRLRVFSFYSDAGQFGASQGHIAVVAAIMAIGPFSLRRKIIYGAVAACCLYGMLISGTRGALAVPAAGGVAFLFTSRNTRLLMLGLLVMAGTFVMLKYTYIGQGIPQVSRMRTALDPNDASFQTRLDNQRMLSAYMATRPLGGGIGTAGFWGLRFSPNTFLAQTPTDSWYVKIWAETGVIGICIYFGWLGIILGFGGAILRRARPGPMHQTLQGLYCGMAGILLASYGNGVLGAPPTGPIIYVSIAFLFLYSKSLGNATEQYS